MKTIDDIKYAHKSSTFKHTKDGLIAVRGWLSWFYYRFDSKDQCYKLTGTTEKFND